jgi:hypothetical protein
MSTWKGNSSESWCDATACEKRECQSCATLGPLTARVSAG